MHRMWTLALCARRRRPVATATELNWGASGLLQDVRALRAFFNVLCCWSFKASLTSSGVRSSKGPLTSTAAVAVSATISWYSMICDWAGLLVFGAVQTGRPKAFGHGVRDMQVQEDFEAAYIHTPAFL